MAKQTAQFLNNILMNGIKDMVFVMEVRDGHFVYRFLNQAAMERAGLTDEVIGKTIEEVYPVNKAAFLIDKYKSVLETKTHKVFDDSFPSEIGDETCFGKNLLTPLFDEQNNCTHIVAAVQDVTEKVQAEAQARKSKELLVESKQRYQSLFEYNLDAIVVLDPEGRIISGNRAVELITSYTLAELTSKRFTELIVQNDIKKAIHYFKLALDGVLEECRITMINKSNSLIELIVKFTPIIVKDKIVGIYVICKDITEQIKLRDKYNESENIFKIITEHTRDLITMLDSDGKIIYVSPSYKDILNYSQHEYAGKHFTHNVHPSDSDHLLKTFYMSKKTGEPWIVQFRQKHHTEGWIWSELHGSPVFNENGEFERMVVVSRDVSLRKDYEAKLQYFAFHDPLTDLPNRRHLNEQLEHVLQEYQGTGKRLAVILLDLDQFKSINDTFGHGSGDEVIKEFGTRVGSIIGEEDTLARLGGDEFVVLVQNVESEKTVINVAKRIIDVVQRPWRIGEDEFHQTASIGIAISTLKTNSVLSLFKTADEALYEVKRNGGNGYKLKNS